MELSILSVSDLVFHSIRNIFDRSFSIAGPQTQCSVDKGTLEAHLM